MICSIVTFWSQVVIHWAEFCTWFIVVSPLACGNNPSWMCTVDQRCWWHTCLHNCLSCMCDRIMLKSFQLPCFSIFPHLHLCHQRLHFFNALIVPLVVQEPCQTVLIINVCVSKRKACTTATKQTLCIQDVKPIETVTVIDRYCIELVLKPINVFHMYNTIKQWIVI